MELLVLWVTRRHGDLRVTDHTEGSAIHRPHTRRLVQKKTLSHFFLCPCVAALPSPVYQWPPCQRWDFHRWTQCVFSVCTHVRVIKVSWREDSIPLINHPALFPCSTFLFVMLSFKVKKQMFRKQNNGRVTIAIIVIVIIVIIAFLISIGSWNPFPKQSVFFMARTLDRIIVLRYGMYSLFAQWMNCVP